LRLRTKSVEFIILPSVDHKQLLTKCVAEKRISKSKYFFN